MTAIIKVEPPEALQRLCVMLVGCSGPVKCLVIGRRDEWGNESTNSMALCAKHRAMVREALRDKDTVRETMLEWTQEYLERDDQ